MGLLLPPPRLAMRDYRRLEAYRLARTLMARIYSNTSDDACAERLRHASLAAATRILEGSSRASDEDFQAGLAAASSSLAEVADLIPSCRRSGSLPPDLADLLLAQRNEAAAAVASLLGAGAAAPPAAPRAH